DFRENDLLGHTHRVVATTVESLWIEATEVTDTRNGNANQTIEKIVHTFATQRYLAPDWPSSTDLESCNGFTRLGNNNFLPTDGSQFVSGVFQQLLVTYCFAYAHVQNHFRDLGDAHRIIIPKLLCQCGY